LKLNKTLIFNVVIGLFIASLVVIFSERGLFRRLELASSDFLFWIRKSPPHSDKIIIIEITDEDIAKVGRWPWDRIWHAASIKAMKDLGAKHIYLDILFSEDSSKENDDALGLAIKEAGCVYLPFAFQDETFDKESILMPIEEVSSYVKGTGSINIYPDIDGTLRKVPLFFKKEGEFYPHITLKLAMDYLGADIKEIEDDFLILANSKDEIKIPLVDGNNMLINWLGRWGKVFYHYSVLDVINAYNDRLKGKEPIIDIEPFKDGISLLVVTAIALHDIEAVPLEPLYPGVGIIATSITNIIDKNFIRPVSPWINWVFIYILALIPCLLISIERPLLEPLLTVSIGGIFFIGSFLAFQRGVLLNFSLPLFSLFGTHITIATYNFICAAIEKKRFFNLAITDGLTNLYNVRYFRMILKAECLMAKADPHKNFCIIMTDIDHFKTFNDTYGHQVGDLVLKEVASVLKESVRTSDLVSRYGGEEMIILLRGASMDVAKDIAEKIRKNVEDHTVKDEKNTYKVTISLGVANIIAGETEEMIIKKVDQGLYKAKESGRNRVEIV